VNQGVPLQKALADAAAQYLGDVDEGRIAGLSGQLKGLLPSDVTQDVKGKPLTTKRAVTMISPKEVRAWKKDIQEGRSAVPFKEALADYDEFRKSWSEVIRNGKVTPREIAEIRERFGLTDDEFYSLLALHNQAQGPQNPDLDAFIK